MLYDVITRTLNSREKKEKVRFQVGTHSPYGGTTPLLLSCSHGNPWLDWTLEPHGFYSSKSKSKTQEPIILIYRVSTIGHWGLPGRIENNHRALFVRNVGSLSGAYLAKG